MRIVDACAHPRLSSTAELREFMTEPWRSRPVPGHGHGQYAAATTDGPATMDRATAVTELIERRGISDVVLLPLTRGLLPNVDLGSAICAATNDWLAQTWLDGSANGDSGFWGSIRINPSDPDAAIAELERWAGHPRFVQVAVPTQAHHPYGQRMYFRIWEAAARHGLPVAIHTDGGAGADFAPTPVGYPRQLIEYATLQPLNAGWHLASFIAEGVLERLPQLRVVCAEGGLDTMTPIFWRLDKDWRSNREEIPWAKRLPTRYLTEQIRFCSHRVDRPPPAVALERWLEVTSAADVLMYASNFPEWDTQDPAIDVPDGTTGERILSSNARELYGLP